MSTTLFDIRTYEADKHYPRKLIRDMPAQERPAYRIEHVGSRSVSTTELLAVIFGTSDGLDLAGEMLASTRNLIDLARMTTAEIGQFKGVGKKKALQLKAALELGRRVYHCTPDELPRITAPADAANFLMTDMMALEQEHLIVLTLNTRNHVTSTQTLYIGSLNTSVIRLGEIFRHAIRNNAAAIIVAHNHPSGDPSPSPEDVNVTRQLVEMGKKIDINVLDHLIIGHNRYTSLKERGLGFD